MKVKAGRVPSIFRGQPVKQKATRPPPKNRAASFVESKKESDQHKDIFACLFSIHSIISLS